MSKILIVYWTKYGATREIAEKLKERLGEDCQLKEVKEVKNEEMENYDWVLIGSPLYMFRLAKQVSKFMREKRDRLMENRIGIFLSCTMTPDQFRGSGKEKWLCGFMDDAFREHIELCKILGGRRIFDRLKLGDRMILKIGKKKYPQIDIEDFDRFYDDEIENFVDKIRNSSSR